MLDFTHWGLKPWESTSDLSASERGFTGRRWLLDGLVDPPLGSSDPDTEQAIGEIDSWRSNLSGPSVFWISAGPGQEALLKRLLNDEDIWPVQDIFRVMQEFSESLLSRHERLSASSAPIVASVPYWQHESCGWAEFESAATAAKSNRAL